MLFFRLIICIIQWSSPRCSIQNFVTAYFMHPCCPFQVSIFRQVHISEASNIFLRFSHDTEMTINVQLLVQPAGNLSEYRKKYKFSPLNADVARANDCSGSMYVTLLGSADGSGLTRPSEPVAAILAIAGPAKDGWATADRTVGNDYIPKSTQCHFSLVTVRVAKKATKTTCVNTSD